MIMPSFWERRSLKTCEMNQGKASLYKGTGHLFVTPGDFLGSRHPGREPTTCRLNKIPRFSFPNRKNSWCSRPLKLYTRRFAYKAAILDDTKTGTIFRLNREGKHGRKDEKKKTKKQNKKDRRKKEFSWKDLFYRHCRRRYCNNYASLLFFTRRLGVA